MFDFQIPLNLLIILILIYGTYDTDGGCSARWPKCKSTDNVVCRHGGSCDPQSSNCNPIYFSNALRNSLVEKHNELRNKIAGGKDTRGGAKSASNMMVLNYDFALEYSASCTANTCVMQHEECRTTPQFSSVGQNLYMGPVISRGIDAWYEEIDLMSAGVFEHFQGSGIGHFTQVVWAETTHVGCAAAEKGGSIYLACNYGPAGNWLDSSVYIAGDPASKCPNGEVSGVYDSLCGVAYKLQPRGEFFYKMNAGRPNLAKYLIFIVVLIIFI